MPGEGEQKFRLMADLACRRVFNRDFNAKDDRLVREGDPTLPHQNCRLLVDVGPVDALEPPILHFEWDSNAQEL
jgi:hypothetical protein